MRMLVPCSSILVIKEEREVEEEEEDFREAGNKAILMQGLGSIILSFFCVGSFGSERKAKVNDGIKGHWSQ